MECQRLVLLCLASMSTSLHAPGAQDPTNDRFSKEYRSKSTPAFRLQNNYSSNNKDSVYQNSIKQHNTNHQTVGNFSTIYKQHQSNYHLLLKRNDGNHSEPQLFPSGFGRHSNLHHNRRDSSGWSSWGMNLLNQYVGSGRPGWGWGSSSGYIKPQDDKGSQASQIAKVIVSKAKLMSQLLELKSISTRKFLNAMIYLSKIKSATLPLFGNLNNPHHYLYNQAPTLASDKLVPTHGWESSVNVDTHHNANGFGSGWEAGTKETAYRNLGYTLGSKLAGVSKFAKLIGDGYSFGTEGQRWLTHGFGHHNVHDYYPYKNSDSNIRQLNADQTTGTEVFKGHNNYNKNPPLVGNAGYGYNYGSGNEYSSSNSFHANNAGNVGGGGNVGGSGSLDNLYDDITTGGNAITSGLRVPNFRPL